MSDSHSLINSLSNSCVAALMNKASKDADRALNEYTAFALQQNPADVQKIIAIADLFSEAARSLYHCALHDMNVFLLAANSDILALKELRDSLAEKKGPKLYR